MGTLGTNLRETASPAPVGPMNAQSELMHELMLRRAACARSRKKLAASRRSIPTSLTTAFERIIEANSRYYVLGYYPPTHARDGRFHKIEVRVKRPGPEGDGAPRICVAARTDGRGAQEG